MQKMGIEVTGIDLSTDALAYASRFYGGPRYLLDDVSTHKGDYDWVVSFETIEHLEDPSMALKCFRYAQWLLCSTPNQDRYPFVAKAYANDQFPHRRHYTPYEFDALLKSCGWNVVERHCQVGKKSAVTDGTDGKFLVYLCK